MGKVTRYVAVCEVDGMGLWQRYNEVQLLDGIVVIVLGESLVETHRWVRPGAWSEWG